MNRQDNCRHVAQKPKVTYNMAIHSGQFHSIWKFMNETNECMAPIQAICPNLGAYAYKTIKIVRPGTPQGDTYGCGKAYLKSLCNVPVAGGLLL